jgi:hypothetical protein
MNDCKRMSDLFGALHDEQLEGEIAESVRQHLSNCAECREDFKWYGFTVHALAGLEKVSPPRDFLAQFHARVDADRPLHFLESFRNIFTLVPHFPLSVGVTALAVMTVIGLSLYNYGPMYGVQSAASSGYSPKSEMAPSAKGIVPVMARSQERASSGGVSPVTPYPAPVARLEAGPGFRAIPAVQDRIGTDMLTVESPSIDQAVESLKKILPDIQGKILEEENRQIGGTILTVAIPYQAYGHLTTELINHGAVAVGPKTDNRSTTDDTGTMQLYIHFLRK